MEMTRKEATRKSRDMKEIEEVINCDADVETKCKMISNILTAKPHYFEEPFINKPCVSSGVCEYDKQKVLNKIKAEIEPIRKIYLDMNDIDWLNGCDYVLSMIDKYKTEGEE